MVVNKPRLRVPVAVITGGILLALSACGTDEVAQTFTGGSNSKDKQPIPPAVQTAQVVPAPAGSAAQTAARVNEPAVATKTDAPKLVEGRPIREKEMKYRSGGARDPFRSLLGDGEDRSDLVDLNVVTLVGIVYGDEPFCTVEDAEGTTYVLRKGDRVKNGRIVSINRDTVVASQTLLGYTTTVQLKLEEGKESHG